MKPPVAGWIRIRTKDEVLVPEMEGKGIAARISITLPAWKDPRSGEVFYDGEARQLIDDTKARHMGLLLPDQMRKLRRRLGFTQKEMGQLLQLGEKTWTRWETGRERPSRSLNVLLTAIQEGQLGATYLKDLRARQMACAMPTGMQKTADYTQASLARHAPRRVAEPSVRYGLRKAKPKRPV